MRLIGRSVVALVLGVVFMLSVISRADAQEAGGGTLRGRVVALETGQPLGTANIVLYAADRSSVVGATMTDAAGRFLLVGVRPGSYSLEFGYIGYAPQVREVTVVAGQTLDLGTIELTVEAITLEEVTVETQRPPVVFAPDRDIYSAASLPGADGGVATELMSSIPELEVDIDGTIMLRGGTPRIYINGRPAPMEGEALTAFLEQFPADQIERIEVIPNPSARYDAQGAGGIINIVLKEGASLGMSGSAFTSVDTRGSTGGGGQATWQRGRLTLHGSAFVRRSDQETTGYDLRQLLLDDPPTYFRQDTWRDRGHLFGTGRMTAELQLGERSTVRAEGRFMRFGSDSEGSTLTTHMDHLQQPTRRYDRRSRSESSRRSLEGILGFTHAFEPERHTFEVELKFDSGSNDRDEWVETEFELVGPDDGPIPADLTEEDADEDDREIQLEIDYVRPWGEDGRIEVGYRGSFESREDQRVLMEYEELPDGDLEVDVRPRGFTHDETFHSGYLTVAQKLGGFGVQIGGRVQWSDTRFEVPTGDAFETSNVDFFPSAHLTYDWDEGRRLRLSYSRRTRRPQPWRLNPIDTSTDPMNRNVGNPDLEPQYTHSIGLDASASMPWGTLRVSPYVRRVTNDWARIRRVDEDGVSTTTWENIASQDMYGASITASVRLPDGWNGFLSLDGRGEDRDAHNLGRNISGRTFSWSMRGNVSGQLVRGLGLRANLSYRPARDVPQGRIGSRVDSSIGLRQRLMDGRLTLALMARDPFDISRTDFRSSDPTFIQLGESRESRQSVAFNLSYNFGGGGRAARSNEQGRGRGPRR